MRLSQVAAQIAGYLEGPDLEVSHLAAPETAQPGQLVVVREDRFLETALSSGAALLLAENALCPDGVSRIRVPDVAKVWPKVLELFDAPRQAKQGVHPTATLEAESEVAPTASIGAYSYVCSGARVLSQAVIGAYCYVGEGAEVGEGAVLEPRVTLYRQTIVGPGCWIGSGAILGTLGFGFQEGQRLPHSGRVVLEESVELGAASVVQRSLVGETRIGAHSKIGDVTQIGHNVQIGRGVVMVGSSGLAGSVVLEDGVLMGAQVMVADHVRIGKGARIAAGSGISKDVPAGETWAGAMLARPVREHWRRLALLDWLLGVERKLRTLLRSQDD
ncbi:MAG: UDP-3-O-(3-hydroxymyristoyl)glucosamine N-acyltransferase [Thermaceae bacterium]|nr:UDP-3-O-(3-hydroxymyristoyl)glucosamine N-acyltransferase [Thermaceae bacterium]